MMMEATREEVASLKHTTDARQIRQLEILSDHEQQQQLNQTERLWQRKWVNCLLLIVLALNGLVLACVMSESLTMNHLKSTALQLFQSTHAINSSSTGIDSGSSSGNGNDTSSNHAMQSVESFTQTNATETPKLAETLTPMETPKPTEPPTPTVTTAPMETSQPTEPPKPTEAIAPTETPIPTVTLPETPVETPAPVHEPELTATPKSSNESNPETIAAMREESTPSQSIAEPTPSATPECVKLFEHHVDLRFAPKTMCVSRQEIQQTLIHLVLTVADAFDKANITYWLDSGTLLGSYREHTVIPHDVDADFGMDEASYLKIRDSSMDLVQFPAGFIMDVFNSTIHPDGGRDANIPLRIIDTRTGFYVDVFVFFPEVDHDTGKELMGPIASGCFNGCVHCPKNEEEDTKHFIIPKTWIFPLIDCPWAEHWVKCPQETPHYLEHLYGDDYMTPHLRRSRRTRS